MAQTSRWLAAWPIPTSATAKVRMLLQVQRKGDIGSPRANGSTKRSRILHEGRVALARAFPAATWTTHASRRHRPGPGDLLLTTRHGRSCQARDPRDAGHPAIANRVGLGGGDHAQRALVQHRCQSRKSLLNLGVRTHRRQYTNLLVEL